MPTQGQRKSNTESPRRRERADRKEARSFKETTEAGREFLKFTHLKLKNLCRRSRPSS